MMTVSSDKTRLMGRYFWLDTLRRTDSNTNILKNATSSPVPRPGLSPVRRKNGDRDLVDFAHFAEDVHRLHRDLIVSRREEKGK